MKKPLAWYRHPESWQLGLFLIMLALSSISIAICQIALGAAASILLYRWIARGDRPPRTGVEWPALLLAGWALAMIPLSTHPHQSLLFYKRFYLFAAFWVGCSISTSERNRLWMLLALLAGTMAVVLAGEVEIARSPGGFLYTRMDAQGNAMTGGAMTMMIFLLTVGVTIVGRIERRWRIIVAACGALIGVALLQTMTRSALVGTVFGIGAMLFLVSRRRFLVYAVVVVVIVVGLWQFGDARSFGGIGLRFDPEYVATGSSSVRRFEMWQCGWEMIKAHPFTGVGDRDLSAIVTDYAEAADSRYYGHLHSNPIMLAAIWGLPGLVLAQIFTLALVVAVLRRWRSLVKGPDGVATAPMLAGWMLGAVGAWTGFFVAGAAEWYFGDAEPMLLYLAIMGVACGAVGDRNGSSISS